MANETEHTYDADNIHRVTDCEKCQHDLKEVAAQNEPLKETA